MKDKTLLLIWIFALSFLTLSVKASDKDSTKSQYSFGITSGYAQNGTLSGNAYFGLSFPYRDQSFDLNFGYQYFESLTEYGGVQDLVFHSHGLFSEGNFYVSPNLYLGLRLALDFNLVEQTSRNRFAPLIEIDSPELFTGFSLFTQLGYRIPVTEHLGIKLEGQIGLHNYWISEGWIIIPSSDSQVRNARFGTYRRFGFLYNLNLGLHYRL